MRCPRCQHATRDEDASCAGCGAPLALAEEPRLASLDLELDLDRRHALVAPRAAGAHREADPVRSVAEEPPWSLGVGPVEVGGRAPSEAHLHADEPAVVVGDVAAPAASLDEVDESAVAPGHRAAFEAPGGVATPASIARRAGAAALDLATVAAAAAVPILLAARGLPSARAPEVLIPACGAFVAVLAFTYAMLGHALMGATLGKRLLGIRVTGPDGAAPGLARSAARAGVAVIGTAALGVGMVAGLFTGSGRALHDAVAGTAVVRAVEPTRREA